ncbi:hypothetical protein QM012_004853 [Aureobasidium pullulans]|uniref:F-box domain-containing protein n=1 Tax=Aureobasidium pullulans TaxID=5580 RepID=A0ABR0TU97_AURPU
MDNSPLSRLPLELREQILNYLMPSEIKHITSCPNQNASIDSLDLVKRMMISLARRHAFVATCRELQRLGLRLDLRRTEFVWDCCLAPSSSASCKDMQNQKDETAVVFHTLPGLHSQGLIGSIRGVGGAISDDYLHRESWITNGLSDAQRQVKQANWTNEPLEILSMYEKATRIAFHLRTEQRLRELGHHQIFYRHSYRLQAFTDGNAARPIKKALRRTWKRDAIEITIDMLSEVISLQRLGEAITLLDGEHLQKTEAVQIEIDRQAPPSSISISSDIERSTYLQFVRDMDTKYSRWRQRIKKFHEGLIEVVMLGYMSSYHEVESIMKRMQDGIDQVPPLNCTGDQVVDTVIEMVKAEKLHNMELSQQRRN